MRKLIAPILLFSVALFGQQDAVITGQVTSSMTGEPLPGANVMVTLTSYGSATDINGEYIITVPASSVQGQEAKVTARFIGFTFCAPSFLSSSAKISSKPNIVLANM